MAVQHELEIESDFAKNYVLNCSEMDEDYKRELINLIDLTKMATNGISQEQKIQKITESIAKLAISQVGLVKSIKNIIVDTIQEQNSKIDERIIKAITAANTKQCQKCKAMKHADDVEQQERNKSIIEEYKKQMGITDEELKDSKDKTWTEVIKTVLTKPYIYIVTSILLFSPYGVQIVNSILNFCSK